MGVNILSKGLSTDTPILHQPDNTYLYALNAVLESEDGNVGLISNENSNIECAKIKDNYSIIGHCYIGDNQTVIFSVSNDNITSEIGILYNTECKYESIVNTNDLQFNLNYQINATYRVKNGCDKIIYWTDGLNYPRQFNFNKQSQYQNSNNNWVASKFNIQKLSKSIPQYNYIKVLNSGGNLIPGSYQIAIQYIDDNNNPSEWMNISNKILIYNDSMLSDFDTIKGSIHIDKVKELNFPNTNKAIEITLKNLDSNFNYIRYAIIGFYNGTGEVSNIFVTDKISTKNKSVFIFTGNNYIETINENDLVQFNNIIATAKNIAQLDNRLILSNITSENIEWYKLQQFASQIQADCVVKSISMDSLSITNNELDNEDNPKHPLQYFGGSGYLPGELYSFGIVYVLENGQTSPVFHIPGKNKDDKEIVYTNDDNTYPMSIDNQIDVIYENNSLCQNIDYWGLDNKKRTLLNQKVRHHRFPTRRELKIPHITQDYGSSQNILLKISFQITGDFYKDVYYRMNENGQAVNKDGELILDDEGKPITNALKKLYPPMSLKATYMNNDGNTTTYEETITNLNDDEIHYDGDVETETKHINYTFTLPETFNNWSDNTEVKFEVNYGNEWILLNEHQNSDDIKKHWKTFSISKAQIKDYVSNKSTYKSNILGIQFSNIITPNIKILGHKVIGYYIVQQERTLENKSILDSGVMIPALKYEKYIGCGLVAPEGKLAKENLYKNAVGLINYSQLFDNYNIGSDIIIEHEGNYIISKRSNTLNIYNDVMEGSSYQQLKSRDKELDDENGDLYFNTWEDKELGIDGFNAAIYFRNNEIQFDSLIDSNDDFNLTASDINQFTLLNPFDTCYIDDEQDPVFYNMMLDQSITCVEFKHGKFSHQFYNADNKLSLPYVILKRNIKNQYSDFRTGSYYKFQNNYNLFNNNTSSTAKIFNGNSFISAIQFNSTLYYDTKAPIASSRSRNFWESAWGYIIGGIAIIAGTALEIFTAGASTTLIYIGAGLIAAGAGTTLLTGLKQVQYTNLINAIKSHYKVGLQKTIVDDWVYDCFHSKYWYDHYKINDISKIYVDSLYLFANTIAPSLVNGKRPTMNHVQLSVKEFINTGHTDLGLYWDGDTKKEEVQYADDTLIYLNDSLNCLWFESEYNAFVRTAMTNKLPAFLLANTIFEPFIFEQPKDTDNSWFLMRIDGANNDWKREPDNPYPVFQIQTKNDISANSKIEAFVNQKMFSIKDDKNTINAVPIPEFYAINPDYLQQKLYQKYYMIPSTYNFCSQCAEKFPTRWTWSETSFNEEVNDNYSVFKPNNYKDITASTGEITNMFIQNNNLFFHTKEALYLQPKAYQERATDQIITYIGTGEYGNLPERKIIDDNTGLSAGLSNKWYSLQNKFGYFFVSEAENIIYVFNQKLDSISNTGLRKWFHNNIPFKNDTYNEITSIIGKGFVFGYDPKYQRILLTKQDIKPIVNINQNDLLINNYIFHNYNYEKEQLEKEGYTFEGFEYKDSQYVSKFSKHIKKTETVIEYINTFPTTDYLVFYYDFSSTGRLDLDNKTSLIIDGKKLSEDDIDYVGYNYPKQLYRLKLDDYVVIKHSGDNVGTGLESFYIDIKRIKELRPNLKEIQFDTSAIWYAQKAKQNEGKPNIVHLRMQLFKDGKMEINNFKWENPTGTQLGSANGYLLDPKQITKNGVPTDVYESTGFYNFNLNTGELTCDGKKIDALENIKVPTEITKTIETTDYKYLIGDKISNEEYTKSSISNSYTLSYSLLTKQWVSFHSYIPYGYITMPDNLYSYTHQNNIIYKHNQDYHYQSFYGKNQPFIIEYVDKTMSTNLTDYITFKTTCLKYDIDTDELLEVKLKTFNQAIIYNSRQCSGLLELRFKDESNYLQEQIQDNDYTLIDKTEEDFNINDFRDIRTDYSKPIFNSNVNNRLYEYKDKILNEITLDKNKNWTELEPFRDKYLIIRLIFNNFDNQNYSGLYKLIVNYLVNRNEPISIR